MPLAGWLGRRRGSLWLAAVPAALSGYFAYIFRGVARDGPFSVTAGWAPALNLSLSFRFDGLSLLFAILITAVGALIVVYGTTYLAAHRDVARFHVALFAFMGSMLGLVLADNVILLFVFWELTGFTSFLLIGFEHDRPAARRAATQALIVTGGEAWRCSPQEFSSSAPLARRCCRRWCSPAASLVTGSTPASWSWCSSRPSRSPRSSLSTSGCPTRCRHRHRSAPTCIPPRW